jgi:hypothetical protein
MEAMVITKITAPPIPAAVSTFFDTPTKEQIPRNWLNTTLLTRAELIAITSNSFIYASSYSSFFASLSLQLAQSPQHPDFFSFFTEPFVAHGAFSLF